MDHQPLVAGGSGIRVLPVSTVACLTRVAGFHATHRLYRPDWTDAQNREAFGPGATPPGMATTIAAHLFGRLAPRLPDDAVLERVRIMEDPTLYADCTGPT